MEDIYIGLYWCCSCGSVWNSSKPLGYAKFV
jgi:hypothetical protein